MDLNLKNKVVLINGAAGVRGSIGETMVRSLAEEGAIPAIIDISNRGFEYVEELASMGIDAMFVKADLTDPDQVKGAVAKVVEKYNRIEVVINNIGANDGAGLDSSYEDFMNSLKLNVVSHFLTVKYALPKLKESKGNILNIGSKVALTGQGSTSGYAAAKGGVLALTREWAVDLISDEIRVNALIISECWTPSYDQWVKTLDNGEEKLKSIISKIPLQNRMTTPLEVANTAMFVISDKSSHTTGQHIFIDGGYAHLDRALLSERK